MDNLFLFIVKFIAFIILTTSFLTLGAIALHEFGHSLMGAYYGCAKNKIVFEFGEQPFTDLQCQGRANILVILIAGYLMTSIASLLFFLSTQGALRWAAGVVFSIGAIASSKDLLAMSVSGFSIVLIHLGAYTLFALSVYKLAYSYIQGHIGMDVHKK